MEESTKEFLTRLARMGQHLEGTENALCRIDERLLGTEKAITSIAHWCHLKKLQKHDAEQLKVLLRIAEALEAIHEDLDKGNQLRWPLSGMPDSDGRY